MEIEVRGMVTVEADVRTLGDLRTLMEQVDEWGLPSDTSLDWGQSKLFIDVHPNATKAEVVDCGSHIPERKADGTFRDGPIDFIIAGHECSVWEQPSLSTEREPSEFDWPTKDRQSRA